MDFPQDSHNGNANTPLFDAGFAAELSALAMMPRAGNGLMDWDTNCLDLAAPTALNSPLGTYPAHTTPCRATSFSHAGPSTDLDLLSSPLTSISSLGGVPAPARREAASCPDATLNASRAARNGREQQRAQKISDLIDKLKGMLDRANAAESPASSKLHVLTTCENYLRALRSRTRRYELEQKLRAVARGRTTNFMGTGGDDDDGGTIVSDRAVQEKNLYFYEPAAVMSGSEIGPFSSTRPSSASSTISSSGFEGDAGSTDGGGLSTSDQGFTTDTASREFMTDTSGYGGSSFGGDSGSGDSSGDVGSGDSGSADGGSDGSEEGSARPRMRVVNYFDIFRLSNVPMAIASKDGAVIDVNDAMRGFGRIDQDAAKSLTVDSLVAPDSSKALRDAMREMLNSRASPSEGATGHSTKHSSSQPPFSASASIGDRPTLLTVSLVCDEQGQPNAFHIALISRHHNAPTEGADSRTPTFFGQPPQRCSLGGLDPTVNRSKRTAFRRDDGQAAETTNSRPVKRVSCEVQQ